MSLSIRWELLPKDKHFITFRARLLHSFIQYLVYSNFIKFLILLFFDLSNYRLSLYIKNFLKGMGSLYTITAMAVIRYKSVVQFERWWHMLTIGTYFSSNYVRMIWSFSLLIAVPPLVGIGKYVIDIGMVRY